MITPEIVRNLFNYSPETGQLTWRVQASSTAKIDSVAGCFCNYGRYMHVGIFGKKYQVHRVIWMHFYGDMPKGFIDHIDGNGLNNRIENLRDVSHQTNCMNLARNKKNTSGVPGVYWHKKAKKWHAQVSHLGKVYYLGLFDDIHDASDTVKRKRADFGFHANHLQR